MELSGSLLDEDAEVKGCSDKKGVVESGEWRVVRGGRFVDFCLSEICRVTLSSPVL